MSNYAQVQISKDVEQYLQSLEFPQETKRDTLPFSDQLPYSTVPKGYNLQGYRPDIAEFTHNKGDKVCFNTETSKVPFYLRSWQPFESSNFVPFAGDVLKDPRYSSITNNFSNQYKNLQ